jgi:uncharacterized damage-inducible protein DinB
MRICLAKIWTITLGMACTLAAQDSNPLMTEARQAYSTVKYNLLMSAEKMPGENYSFRPAPRVRTFAQILGHIAEEHYLYCGAVKGEEKAVDVEKSKTAKAEVIAALKDSFAYCEAVYDGLTDTTAVQMIHRGQMQRTRLWIVWGNTVHDNSHYGNLVTYMRIKGLVPPSTEGQ